MPLAHVENVQCVEILCIDRDDWYFYTGHVFVEENVQFQFQFVDFDSLLKLLLSCNKLLDSRV